MVSALMIIRVCGQKQPSGTKYNVCTRREVHLPLVPMVVPTNFQRRACAPESPGKALPCRCPGPRQQGSVPLAPSASAVVEPGGQRPTTGRTEPSPLSSHLHSALPRGLAFLSRLQPSALYRSLEAALVNSPVISGCKMQQAVVSP